MRPIELERILSRIVRWGLFLVLVLPLYISSSLLFPFITGRNFAFRIIIEVIAVAWVGLLFLSREYWPKLSGLNRAILAFLFIVTLADVLGANPYRSLWSNYERMEGLMMIVHMVLFFFILVSVFRKFSQWRWYVYASSAVSIIVAFIGILQKLGLTRSYQGGERVDSTIGNPAYLASYLMFHVFLLSFLLFRERTAWLRWGSVAAILLQLFVIYLTATRGVILALIGIVGLMAITLVFWTEPSTMGRRIRKVAVGILVAGILFVGGFWLLRDKAFIRESPVLSRFAALSFEEKTIQSRFLIWNMAWQGVRERPILGWGQENFYLIFNKHFNPELFANEPWFDRSHNVIFDWLVHAGILGLLSYLFVLFFGARNIWLALRAGTITIYEGLLLEGLLAAYFLQNIFVFDNFQTYFLLFSVLGFSEYARYAARGKEATSEAVSKKIDAALIGMGVAGVAAVLILYFAIARPVLASRQIIRALQENGRGGSVTAVQGEFVKALEYESFGTSEALEQMASLSRGMPTSQRGTPEERKGFIDFTASSFEKFVAGPSPDAKHLLFLGSVYNSGILFDLSYASKAQAVLNRAVELAPKKQQIYFELGNTYLAVRDYANALSVLKIPVELTPAFPQAQLNFAMAAILAGEREAADKAIATHRSLVGKMSVGDLRRLIYAYVETNDLKSVRPLLEEAISLDPANGELYGQYAALLATLGDREGAIRAARKAAEINPAMQPQVDQFIADVEAGKFSQ